ncbi:MAG: IS110 family transposase [Desulfobacteraceae bacterium A6]|nr:MAG: IS110 family transposase [Desulfobacteraceae bacterium A6]
MNSTETIRRKEYCQITEEICGSEQYMIVGIDVAKDKHHAFIGTANGKVLSRKLIFENNRKGFSRLIDQAQFLQTQNGLSKVVFALEPTGNYHKPLGSYLAGNGFNVVLVSGKSVKNNREVLDGRWDKHDTKDAANVADLASRGRCQYYDRPSEKIIELRDLLSLRRRLKKEEHSLRMRIRNGLLAQYFPELDRFYNACESESLAIVRWCLNPEGIAAMEFDRFFEVVTRNRRGITQKLRLQKIYQAAGESVGCRVKQTAEFEAALLVEKLNQVRNQVHETEDYMKEICQTFPEYDYLLTIPGFGPYVSARVLASVADPFRFDSRKQIIKMAGYDLCANRSGKTSNKAVPVISKNGNGELRYALYQAAKVASSRVDIFRAYFAGMLRSREREKGIIAKMRVKLAAKMLVIAWTLMKKREPFDPAHLNIE